MEQKIIDNVNHPKHYEGSTSFECIETMLLIFGPEYTLAFCVLNAYKYMWRYEIKNGLEDLDKAQWYIDKFYNISEEYDCISVDLEDKAIILKKLLNDKRSKLLNGVN